MTVDASKTIVAVETMSDANHIYQITGFRDGELGSSVGLIIYLGGNFATALLAAAFQHIATGAVAHAFQEAMFAGPRALFGLIGSFWHDSILRYIC